jgi:multidrug resistance efflux pump
MAQDLTEASPRRVPTPYRAEVQTMSDPRPEHTPKPDEIDPEEGTEPDGTPVENPSGSWAEQPELIAA